MSGRLIRFHSEGKMQFDIKKQLSRIIAVVFLIFTQILIGFGQHEGHQMPKPTPVQSLQVITGCPLACACLVAWRFGESSQQSVTPHVLTGPQMDLACADFDARFAFSARRVLYLGNGV
jgi:hypothetical protein